MGSTIAAIDTFIVTLPRDTPYLGPLNTGETVNARGYVVRRGNGTIYPTADRSVIVRITDEDGAIGWGETYGICAPRATCEIVNDLLAPELVGRDASDLSATWDRLYGLMRVRGCWGGFHVDAIAALDIALWDLAGKRHGRPICELIGGSVAARIPSYVSGLPAATLADRVVLAVEHQRRGATAFKFAAVVSHEGIVEEMATLRKALGDHAEIMVDLHWRFDAEEAFDLVADLAPYRPRFVEAPVKPEDIQGLKRLATESGVPIAAGEEWSTSYEAQNRMAAAPIAFIQPEMAHTGITQFLRIAAMALNRETAVAPHATIGTGIFLAASLHASAALPGVWRHEWQHSVFERNLALLDTDMTHDAAGYRLPSGPGLGVEPNASLWQHAEHIA